MLSNFGFGDNMFVTVTSYNLEYFVHGNLKRLDGLLHSIFDFFVDNLANKFDIVIV